MTGELESYLREVIEDIYRRFGQASWIHLNRGQRPELKSYPVDTIVATIDSVHVFLSDDLPLDHVRYQIAGQVREEPLDENVEVEVIDYSRRKDDSVAAQAKRPCPPPKAGRGVSSPLLKNILEIFFIFLMIDSGINLIPSDGQRWPSGG
jgi:hypothetical protein